MRESMGQRDDAGGGSSLPKLPAIGGGSQSSSMSAVVATKAMMRSKRKRKSTKVNRNPMLYQYVVGKGAIVPFARVPRVVTSC